MIIAQFVAESKSGGLVTKNHNVCRLYKIDFKDGNGDGYYYDCTANSEGMYQLNVNSAMFNTTADNNSKRERVDEGSDLNVNATAAKKQRPNFLKGNRRKTFKSSEMLAGAVRKIMTNK